MAATLWFGATAAWEIAGPFGAGHVASSTALGIAGENMFRWGIIAPVTHYSLTAPAPSDYYCHHPWGVFWTTALVVKLLGHVDVACRLAPVLMSAATVPLLYGIGRVLWSPTAGAVAATAYATLPIALAFSNFNALEVPLIFGILLATWGLLRFVETSRRRFMVVSLLGLAHALNSDWPAFVFAAVVLGLLVPRLTLLNGRWYPRVAPRRAWGWWWLAATVSVAVLAFYGIAFWRVGQLDALLDSAQVRSSGSGDPLPDVLASRAHWIETSFTPLATVLGKLAVAVLMFRVVALRRELEVLPLAMLLMATVQYVVFRQGADVHIFWPHAFAPYFALALAGLVASSDELLRMLGPRLPWIGGPRRATPVAFGLGLLVALLILPDGVRALRYARRTGGRFDEKGLLIHQDIDKTVLPKSMAPTL
ncbi:MAG: ArnT family glycosyltransferase, partial [Anaerolineae bacterium]